MADPFALVGMGVVMVGALFGVFGFAATFAVGFGELVYELRDDEVWTTVYIASLVGGIASAAILFTVFG